MAAPKNNRNAAKEGGKSQRVELRCTPKQRAEWEKAAGGAGKLSAWITATLDNSACCQNDTLANRWAAARGCLEKDW